MVAVMIRLARNPFTTNVRKLFDQLLRLHRPRNVDTTADLPDAKRLLDDQLRIPVNDDEFVFESPLQRSLQSLDQRDILRDGDCRRGWIYPPMTADTGKNSLDCTLVRHEAIAIRDQPRRVDPGTRSVKVNPNQDRIPTAARFLLPRLQG